MKKQEALENIPQEAWLQRRAGNGYFALWDLQYKWAAAYFGETYQRIYRDTDPCGDANGSFGFMKPDGSYEFLIFSRAAPMSSYEISWVRGGTGCEPLLNGKPCTTANVSALPNDPGTIALRNSAPNETIQINLDLLESGTAPARAAREAKAIEPWKRAFSWYLFVRANDPDTYMRRLHMAFRQFLESVRPEQYGQEHIQYFQAQQLLPELLPDMGPEHVAQTVADIRAQQQYFNSPHAGRIPRIFMSIDPTKLEVVDLQVLMMMGALKERLGFIDRELLKLGQTNDEIKKLWNTPNGRAAIMQHPLVLQLLQHPQAQREQQENMEKAMRNQGAAAGNLAEVESMLANQKYMAMYTGIGLPPMGGNAPTPPWQIYRPFDPAEPQMGGFDLAGAFKSLGF